MLHNVFRSHTYIDLDGVPAMKKWLHSKFIADFIFLMGAEQKYLAYTSPKAFGNFKKKIIDEENYQAYIDFLEPFIVQIHIPDTEHLEIKEGIVVISDILANVNGFDTIIITDMKKKMGDVANKFYKKTGKRTPIFPFRIMKPEEALIFLKDEYPENCESVIEREELYRKVLSC